MRTATIVAMAILLPFAIQGQHKGKITGSIVDAINRQPLSDATISVLDSTSGLYLRYAVSDRKGDFTVTGLPPDIALQVIVTFTGYLDTIGIIRIPGQSKTVSTGIWVMKPGEVLDSVTVTGSKAPFVIRKDTLEFNATAFKLLPQDMVKDLLRKLPGVSIDLQGNITVNGRTVDRILVDGRDFFGSDMNIALHNLPGGIIEKVQVTATREETQAKKSLIRSANQNLTMNLRLKKDHRKGMFGHAAAGYGSQRLYQGEAFLNGFSGANRYSGFSNANKGNDGGYLGQRYNWGGNINTAIGKKLQTDANYRGVSSQREGMSTTEKQNILADSSFFYNTRSSNTTSTDDHKLSANTKITMDTLQRMNIRTDLSWSLNSNDNNNNALSTTIDGEKINSQQNRQSARMQNYMVSNAMAYSRSSRDGSRIFSMNWNFREEMGKSSFRNRSENAFGNSSDTIDQHGSTRDSRFNNNVAIVMNQMISKSITAIVAYDVSQSSTRTTKNVFDAENRPDSNVSIDNKNDMISHSPGASIGYSNERFAVEMGAGWTIVKQGNKIVTKDSTITIAQRNFSPRINTQWNFSKQSSITALYTMGMSAPSAQELTPVVDNSNPLYVIRGNPLLRTSFSHNMNTALQFFSADLKWTGGIKCDGIFVSRPIVSDIIFDDFGRQVRTWRNASTQTDLRWNISISRSLKVREWTWKMMVEAQARKNEEPGYVNGKLNTLKNTRLSPRVNLNLSYGKIYMTIQGDLQHNKTIYSLGNINNLTYDNKNAMIDCMWTPTDKLSITSNLMYSYNAQLPRDFQRSQTLVGAGATYRLLKNGKLEMSIAVNDIFNNSATISRTITATAIETTQVNVVRRYALFSARYRLSDFRQRR